MANKLTRQGVRDLGGNDTRKKKPVFVIPQQCEHKHMRRQYSSNDNGLDNERWYCPDCDLVFDGI